MSWPILKTYSFVPPPETAGDRLRHPVCIVGAGPVGLLLALELDKRSIPSVVLEPHHRVSEGSRAICISRRSMDILDGVGAGEAFRAKSLGWVRGRSFYRNRLVFELEMPFPPHERHYPMTNLQQFYMEQILIDRAQEAAGVDLRWHSRVVAVTEKPDEEVTCRVETPAGPYDLRSSFLVACDGARSTVRDLLGLELRGSSSSGRYLIADVYLKSEHPTERRVWFNPPCNPGATVLTHKQPDDVWMSGVSISRFSARARPRMNSTKLASAARIQSLLDMIGERAPWRLIWRSLYRAHTLALDDYRHGRVFFAGDAAHLVPIFGVRGLNSGIADANNLGWKLAAVLKGLAPDTLLDTYTPERRGATLDILRESGKSTIFMTPPSAGYELMRNAALSLALDTDVTRCLINPRQSVPYDYVDSPLNTFEGGLCEVRGPARRARRSPTCDWALTAKTTCIVIWGPISRSSPSPRTRRHCAAGRRRPLRPASPPRCCGRGVGTRAGRALGGRAGRIALGPSGWAFMRPALGAECRHSHYPTFSR